MPELAEAVDALHLEGLDGARLELRVLGKLLADLLDQLAGQLHVGIVGDRHDDLFHDPVAAHVLHGAEIAERHREHRAAVVAQPDRAQAERLHRALVAAALDVLADAERVVQHVEDARQHVLHQRLRAEADGDAEDAGAGDQRHDLHAEPRQHGQQPPPRR